MPAAISVVTLLTDFGDRDYFVASMKGVILNINPQARIVERTMVFQQLHINCHGRALPNRLRGIRSAPPAVPYRTRAAEHANHTGGRTGRHPPRPPAPLTPGRMAAAPTTRPAT